MLYGDYQKQDMTQRTGLQSTASVSDKRIHERIIVRLKAVLTFKGMSYIGMIENISEHGLYMISLPVKPQIDFSSGTIHEMKLPTGTGEAVIVHCKIQWAYKTPPYGLTNSISMEVVNPSPAYRRFLGTLV